MKTATQQFLEKFNKAFARSDIDFILDNVTKTIRWTVVGDQTVEGKEAFEKTLNEMAQETNRSSRNCNLFEYYFLYRP